MSVVAVLSRCRRVGAIHESAVAHETNVGLAFSPQPTKNKKRRLTVKPTMMDLETNKNLQEYTGS